MTLRSGYSFRTAYGHLQDVADQVKAVGWDHFPMCDANSTFAFTRGTKIAGKLGLKPIYGVELSVTPALGEKKPILDRWKFLAKTSLRPLHDLIYTATNNPGKEPSLTYAQAVAQEGLFKVAGERCLLDHLPASSDDLFLALSPSTPKGLVRRALSRGLPLLATPDNYYPRPEDLELYRVALGRRAGTQVYPRHIMGDEELSAWLRDNLDLDQATIDQAIANRLAVFGACSATQRKAKLIVPEKPLTLRQMCIDGASRLDIDLTAATYKERLDRELKLIADKDYEDYFYLMADLMTFARSQMVCGPARGSSCGSLVCYLVGITSIDPIPYGLIFERFIDANRGGWMYTQSFVDKLKEAAA